MGVHSRAGLMAALAILCVLTSPAGSSAQPPNPNAATLKALSEDLARLNKLVADQVPSDFYQTKQLGKGSASLSAVAYDLILQAVIAIKDKYQTGPVRVTGFSIDISVPPSVGVQFEFR